MLAVLTNAEKMRADLAEKSLPTLIAVVKACVVDACGRCAGFSAPTKVSSPQSESANKTRDCAEGSGQPSQSNDPGAACGCDYALGEQYRCMREVDGQKVECGCYTCPHEFGQPVQ